MAKKPFEGLTESMFYVLMAFWGREMCGTDISELVERRTAGRVRLGPGTLYTILARFEDEEMIEETAVCGRRRTYRLTEKGKSLYNAELERLRLCIRDAEEAIR